MGGPFCANCKHMQRICAGYDGCEDACMRPLSERRDLVTGELNDHLGFGCYGERRSDKSLFGRVRCGPAGRFFEAK